MPDWMPGAASPWWALYGACVPAIIGGLFKLIGYWRTDAKDDEKRRREREAAEADAEFKQRALLSADQGAWFDRLERERDDLRKRCATAEADATDAWSLVRRLQGEAFIAKPTPRRDYNPTE